MKIAIALLNWNGEKLLERYLPSVVAHSQEADIYVIDNASTDQSVAFLQQQYPEIKIITLNENFGYAGGYNKGLEGIDADYFVLLNSDVEVTAGWLTALRDHVQANPECEMAQPKIRADRQRTHFEYAGACGGYIDSFGFPYCRGRIFTEIEPDLGQYDSPATIDWATGACLLIKAETFRQLGGFDSQFFAHMEEIDLAWRYRNTVKKISVIPQSVVYHLGGATLEVSNPQKTFLNFRNSLLMLLKNLPKNKIFGIIFVRLILDGLAGIRFITQGKPLHCWAIVRAHFAFYGLVGSIWNKRSAKPIANYYHRKSIVWDFFIRGKKKFSELI